MSQEQLSKLLKVLGDENRLRLLHLILQQELCVCDLETVLAMSQTNVSRHLAKLKDVGLVSSTKRAQWVYYQVGPEAKKEYEQLLIYLGQRFSEIAAFQEDTACLQKWLITKSHC